MEYNNTPKFITIEELGRNHFSFAPSKYSDIKYSDGTHFEVLENLIVLATSREKIKKDQKYNYLEIGDIEVNTGMINYKDNFGVFLPSANPIKVEVDDILISTVRTYRRGIAIVDLDNKNIVCTSAFLVIRDVDKRITKEFLYAILRHNFFINQILSLQNRGMYPRLDRETIKFVRIPLPRNKKELSYISENEKEIIKRLGTIGKNQKKIFMIIEDELLNNQLNNNFSYELPNINNLKRLSRLDTGIYSEEFLKIDFLIKNYRNGFYNIPEEKIKSGSTPKKRFIGINPDLKYRWITPTHVSDFGTILCEERINSENYNLNKDAMLLVNRTSRGGRGEYVGLGMFYDISKYGNGYHNQGIYRITDYNSETLKFMTCFMNFPYMRKYCAGLSVGSKMKEVKSSQFATIPFPKFPLDKIKEISNLYSSIIDEDFYIKNIERKLNLFIHTIISKN